MISGSKSHLHDFVRVAPRIAPLGGRILMPPARHTAMLTVTFLLVISTIPMLKVTTQRKLSALGVLPNVNKSDFRCTSERDGIRHGA